MFDQRGACKSGWSNPNSARIKGDSYNIKCWWAASKYDDKRMRLDLSVSKFYKYLKRNDSCTKQQACKKAKTTAGQSITTVDEGDEENI